MIGRGLDKWLLDIVKNGFLRVIKQHVFELFKLLELADDVDDIKFFARFAQCDFLLLQAILDRSLFLAAEDGMPHILFDGVECYTS